MSFTAWATAQHRTIAIWRCAASGLLQSAWRVTGKLASPLPAGSPGGRRSPASSIPHFPAIPQGSPCIRGDMHVTDTLEMVERAYDDWKQGRWSRAPYIDMLIPTQIDPSMTPDGKHGASAEQEGVVETWDVVQGKSASQVEGSKAGLFAVALSRDGKLVAYTNLSAQANVELVLFDQGTGKPARILADARRDLVTLRFSDDGSRLAAASIAKASRTTL